MATRQLNRGIGSLLWAAHALDAGKTDGQLLEQFVHHGDETAFAALVRRHGPMVFGVCRRILGNTADAEDAFQATFLVLVRRAAALSGRPVLGDILHGMARHTALNARRSAARRRMKEQTAARPLVSTAEPRNDVLPFLDEALSRLPEKYRIPIVLCDLEGRTRREAALQLGWPEGTVAGRLARGRELLAKRLLRGAQFFSTAWPGLLGENGIPTPIPQALVNATVQAAAATAAGGAAASAVTSAGASVLAKGVIQSMLWNKIKLGLMVLLATVATVGVGGIGYRVVAGGGAFGADAVADDEAVQNRARPEAPPAKKREPVVRELDLSDFPAGETKTKGQQQTIIDDEEHLAQAVPNKEWHEKVAKQVDFEKERLLYFTWMGGPNDKLTYTVQEPKSGLVVVFQYAFGRVAGNTMRNTHLFALSKDAGFRVEEDKKAPPRDDPAVRELDLKGYKADIPKGTYYTPVEMKTAEELTKIVTDKLLLVRIAKQVDFDKERLVLFAWSGQPSEGFIVSTRPIRDPEDVPVVVFQLVYRLADKPQPEVAHYRIFAIHNKAKWRVEGESRLSPQPETPAPNKDDPTEKLLKDLDSPDAMVRAAAIDLLGERKAKAAIPRLVELVEDGTALVGSDNYVGLHAQHALQRITEQSFNEPRQWQAYLAKQSKEGTIPVGDGGVKVLSADATVELSGVLCDTPKGVFVMVKEVRGGADGRPETATWELDLSRDPALKNQAKELSGKSVVVSGTCKMVWEPPHVPVPMSGVFDPKTPERRWQLDKVVAVSKMTAAEKK